jgi:hypothetical protein
MHTSLAVQESGGVKPEVFQAAREPRRWQKESEGRHTTTEKLESLERDRSFEEIQKGKSLEHNKGRANLHLSRCHPERAANDITTSKIIISRITKINQD